MTTRRPRVRRAWQACSILSIMNGSSWPDPRGQPDHQVCCGRGGAPHPKARTHLRGGRDHHRNARFLIVRHGRGARPAAHGKSTSTATRSGARPAAARHPREHRTARETLRSRGALDHAVHRRAGYARPHRLIRRRRQRKEWSRTPARTAPAPAHPSGRSRRKTYTAAGHPAGTLNLRGEPGDCVRSCGVTSCEKHTSGAIRGDHRPRIAKAARRYTHSKQLADPYTGGHRRKGSRRTVCAYGDGSHCRGRGLRWRRRGGHGDDPGGSRRLSGR